MIDIRKVFEAFSQMNILVIGDVMVDSYLWGDVSRISPEAPIPVVASTHRENRPGGAANVALNLQALGAKPVLCSVTGEGRQRKVLLDLIEKQGMDASAILPDPSRRTTTKTRIISKNQHLLRVDEESDHPLAPETETRLIRKLEEILHGTPIHGIVFEDYDKGVITEKLIRAVVEIAGKKNIPVAVDPKKRNFLHYRKIGLFKPNFRELNQGLKLDLEKSDYEGIFQATREFQEKQEIGILLVSLSELGVYASDGRKYEVIPAEKREIIDVSGAGDTLVSTAALCGVAGVDPWSMARIANLAGGLVCEKVGVVPVEKQNLLEKCLQVFSG